MKRSSKKTTRPRKGKSKARAGIRRRRPLFTKARRSVPDIASLSVTRSLQIPAGGPFIVNNMYDLHQISMDEYDRAVQVSKAYQFFRIKSAKLTFKLGYDTYQAGAGAATRPNLYYMIDKSFSIPTNVTLEQLKAMGARPKVCDNRPVSVSWSPSVLTVDGTPVGPLPVQYKISPWLNTNTAGNVGAFLANSTNHLGIYWYVQMDATGGVAYNYNCELELQFEFKKPLWSSAVGSSVPSVGAVLAELNSSPDGVVGGADEPPIPQ